MQNCQMRAWCDARGPATAQRSGIDDRWGSHRTDIRLAVLADLERVCHLGDGGMARFAISAEGPCPNASRAGCGTKSTRNREVLLSLRPLLHN
jgi:hypothetical protein